MIEGADIFTQLSLVLVVATVISLILRILKQPLIIGYIITGIIAGPSFLHIIQGQDAFETFSEIGIALLLFIIGLELSMAVVKKLGKPVFVTAGALLLTVGTIGYLIGVAFHFTQIEAILIGLALFFSSTIIIAKALSDKKEITRLNGQLAIGVILLDDIIATFALLFIGTHNGGEAMGATEIILMVLKAGIVFVALFVLATKILPNLTKRIAKSQELLFIFALAWGFGVATVIDMIGFSVEIGALFAGVTLAHLPYVHQISARLKPLRDFFIILFFITLGESLRLDSLGSVIVPALILSVVALIIKPFVIMFALGALGYTKHTSFKTGVNLSQVSEFSIIMIVVAVQAGLVRSEFGSIITLVALITITVSTYLIQYDDWIYRKIESKLRLFEGRAVRESKQKKAKRYPLVLFGYQNGGHEFIRTFRSMKLPFVVVDYDPTIIDDLERQRVDYIYGDATDPELLEEIDLEKASLVVNTIGDHQVNQSLLSYIRRVNEDAVVICYSNSHKQADQLYELGASYVFLPQFIGSEQLSSFLHEYGLDRRSFEKVRERHMEEIKMHLASRD